MSNTQEKHCWKKNGQIKLQMQLNIELFQKSWHFWCRQTDLFVEMCGSISAMLVAHSFCRIPLSTTICNENLSCSRSKFHYFHFQIGTYIHKCSRRLMCLRIKNCDHIQSFAKRRNLSSEPKARKATLFLLCFSSYLQIYYSFVAQIWYS